MKGYKRFLLTPLPPNTSSCSAPPFPHLPYHPGYTQPIFTIYPSLSRFPQPLLPNLAELPRILADSLPIALVTFAVSVSLASIYADKYNYTVDSNQV